MLDSSIVATSLFRIAVDFGDIDRINWVPLAYALTYLGCAVLFARVCDVVGRRAAFLAAYVVFVAFSLACGFSRGMAELIAFRAVQGVAGSGRVLLPFLFVSQLGNSHVCGVYDVLACLSSCEQACTACP
jgi:MFS family permease